jgi:hypothetical protein
MTLHLLSNTTAYVSIPYIVKHRRRDATLRWTGLIPTYLKPLFSVPFGSFHVIPTHALQITSTSESVYQHSQLASFLHRFQQSKSCSPQTVTHAASISAELPAYTVALSSRAHTVARTAKVIHSSMNTVAYSSEKDVYVSITLHISLTTSLPTSNTSVAHSSVTTYMLFSRYIPL